MTTFELQCCCKQFFYLFKHIENFYREKEGRGAGGEVGTVQVNICMKRILNFLLWSLANSEFLTVLHTRVCILHKRIYIHINTGTPPPPRLNISRQSSILTADGSCIRFLTVYPVYNIFISVPVDVSCIHYYGSWCVLYPLPGEQMGKHIHHNACWCVLYPLSGQQMADISKTLPR